MEWGKSILSLMLCFGMPKSSYCMGAWATGPRGDLR